MEDKLDAGRFLRMLHEPFVLIAIAIGNVPRIPEPLRRALLHFIACPIGGHFPLKLGEVEQNVSEEPPHGMMHVQALGNGDKLDPVAVEDVRQDMKVFDRPVQRRSIL